MDIKIEELADCVYKLAQALVDLQSRVKELEEEQK